MDQTGRPRGSLCLTAQGTALGVQDTSLKDPTKEEALMRTSRCSRNVRRLRKNLGTYSQHPQGQGNYKSLQKRIFLLVFVCFTSARKMLRKQCWNMTRGQSKSSRCLRLNHHTPSHITLPTMLSKCHSNTRNIPIGQDIQAIERDSKNNS